MAAAAISLVAAFFVRFLFHSLVVYAPRRSVRVSRKAAEQRRRLEIEAAGAE